MAREACSASNGDMAKDPFTSGPAIVLACDDRYALPAGVVIQSILDHCPLGASPRFYIISDQIKPVNRKRLERLVRRAPVRASIDWCEPDLSELAEFPTKGRLCLPRSAYLRLLIPELLCNHENRVIYLDSDVLVQGDLSTLWNIDLEGLALGAVPDLVIDSVGHPQGLDCHELGIAPNLPYFNSGVLLMDLRVCSHSKLYQAAAAYLHSRMGATNYYDQDALNAVLAGSWKILDSTWNIQSPNFYSIWPNVSEWSKVIILCQQRLPKPGGIYHFTGSKPWRLGCEHPQKPFWWQTFARTCWHEPITTLPFLGRI